MSLRIIAGRARGAALTLPPASVRPTSGRRREATFDIIAAQIGDLQRVRFIDLFAGTGAVGLEAWSRGACAVTLVENAPDVLRVLRGNVKGLAATADVTVLAADATRLAPCRQTPFDVAFLDPPYGQGLIEPTLDSLIAGDWLGAEAILLVELGKRDKVEVPSGFALARTYPHGAGRLLRLDRA